MHTYIFIHGGNVSANTWNSVVDTPQYPEGTLLGGHVWDLVTPYIQAAKDKGVRPPSSKDSDNAL